MSSMRAFYFRCARCGSFLPYDSNRYDESTSFGGCEDTEPPDAACICLRCAKYNEDRAVERGWVPNDWRKADWQRRAAKRLGWREVRNSKYTAWTFWLKPEEALPEMAEFVDLAEDPMGVAR